MRKRLLSLALAIVVTASTLFGVTIEPQAAGVTKDVKIPVVKNANGIDNVDNLLSVDFGKFKIGDETDVYRAKFAITEPSYVLLQTSGRDLGKDSYFSYSYTTLERANGTAIASIKPHSDLSNKELKDHYISAVLNPGTYMCSLQVKAWNGHGEREEYDNNGTATVLGVAIPVKKVITYSAVADKKKRVSVKAQSHLGRFSQNMQYRNGKVSLEQVNNKNIGWKYTVMDQ